VDSKAFALLAINLTMLAVLAARLDSADLSTWYIVLCAALAVVGVAYSLGSLYLCAYPNLKGGSGSYVYFQAIANRIESTFVDEFTALDEKRWLRDISCQVWRNSEILSIKFAALKHSFIGTLAALVPWTSALFFTGT